MAGFSDFFLGKPEKTQQFSTLGGDQQQLLQQLISQLTGGPLQQGFGNLSGILSGSPEAFQAYERPAMRQFQEEILPMLAEGFGGMGAERSSGAQQTFARAGRDLSENLAAQRAQLQQGAMDRVLQALGLGLKDTQQTVIRPQSSGFIGQTGNILSSIARFF
jgi:hypothetical protein